MTLSENLKMVIGKKSLRVRELRELIVKRQMYIDKLVSGMDDPFT